MIEGLIVAGFLLGMKKIVKSCTSLLVEVSEEERDRMTDSLRRAKRKESDDFRRDFRRSFTRSGTMI